MRALTWFLAGILVGGALFWAATGGWETLPGAAQNVPRGVPTTMAPGGQVREFRLEARPAKWEIAPGITTDGWTYNGQVPGPELRVREGDLVRITLVNHLPVPTTIHWHGVDLNWKMDGVPGVTQAPVQTGETFTYEFVATPAGTRMYHSHQDPNSQMELGLYGALIIEPRRGPTYDAEHTIILDERALDFTPAVAMGLKDLRGAESGNGRGGALQYDLFLMNGKAGSAIPPILVKPNQRVLLRLINLGNLTHAMHLHGHTFTIVAKDGNPLPRGGRLRMDTVQLSPGERFDLEVATYNPGVWMFHCHMPNHGDNGMMTIMQYEGFAPISPLGHAGHLGVPPKAAQPKTADTGSDLPVAGSVQQPISAPGTGAAPTRSSPSLPSPAGSGSITVIPMLDNRFARPTLTIKAGTTVRWVNRGQNIHTTTSMDGLWDSPGLDRKQRFTFTFARPGEYRYVCRQHLFNGMIGTIVVK